jgi:hypothetical protein
MANSSYGNGRGGGASLLDLAVAALAGGSVAFATYAMPDSLFTQIVVASRLPELLPAAQPPLGDTARWAAVAAAGIVTAILVWALLRALDHVPARRLPQARTAPADGEPSADTPRVRRADAHPDAPTRRPLRAGRELGEPAEEAPPAEDTLDLVEEAPEERFADLIPQPLPGFLVPQEAESATEAGAPEEDEESLKALSAQLPDPERDNGGKSIGDLMQRLESGLSRRSPGVAEQAAVPSVIEPAAESAPASPPPKPSRTPLDLSPPAPPGEEPPPAEDRVGHRLRSAINDLQKLSGHG